MSDSRAAWRAVQRIAPSAAVTDSGSPLEWRADSAAVPRVSPMPLVEEGPFARTLPAARAAFGGFLDGVQESRVAAWLPSGVPLVIARVGAVILERVARRLTPWADGVRESTFIVAPRARLEPRVWDALASAAPMLDSDVAADVQHPELMLSAAVHAVETARAAAERALAERWATEGVAPLCADGSIAALGDAAHAPRIVGLVKSHRTLIVATEDIPALLALAEGQRTRVTALTGSHHRSRVWTWYVRVRAPRPTDPLFGLVRLEVADHGAPTSRADDASAWLMAERTPLALPDARWDVMPYGIARCEAYLKQGRGLRATA